MKFELCSVSWQDKFVDIHKIWIYSLKYIAL